MGRNFRYENLTGGLNNVSSVGTINQTPKRTESPDMVNVEYYKLGGIMTMKGNEQFGDTQESSVIAGWEYEKEGERYMIIGLLNGKVKKYNPITDEFDLIYTFPSQSPRMSFCNMNNGVVITNGIDDMLFYEINRNVLLAGTVSITEGSNVVTGSGTTFGTDVNVGDGIIIDNELYFVNEITSPTELKLSTTALTTASDLTFSLSEVSLCNAYLVNEDDPNLKTPIRGLAINFFSGRLFVGSGNGLYYAELGRYNSWDVKYDAGVIQSFYNDTSEIKALGIYSNYLLIHKEYYTYILSGNEPTTWQIAPYASISCDSQQSWVQTNTKYYVFSKENMGIYPLMQNTVFTDRNLGEDISSRIRNTFLDVLMDETDKIFAVRYPKKRYMMMYFPNQYTLGSSLCTIYDFQTKTWLLRKVPQNVTIAFEYNDDVYIGTDNGKVLREFRGNTFDGEPIYAYWKSPWFEFGDSATYKSIEEFCMFMPEDEQNNFNLNVYRDGDSTKRTRVITGEIYDVNALIWDGIEQTTNNDTTWDNYNWVKQRFNQLRFPTEFSFFRTYQIEFETKEPEQMFAIVGFGFNRVEAEEAVW